MQMGTIKRQVKDEAGRPVGKQSDSPVFDTRHYEVKFQDGEMESYITNLFCEHLYYQVDDEGQIFLMLEDIIFHCVSEGAAPKSEGYWTNPAGRQYQRCTTKGWDILVQ
eukprot:4454949-Ditylum_brightwellii.AAC.1